MVITKGRNLLTTAVCTCEAATELRGAMEDQPNKQLAYVMPIVILYTLGIETAIKALLIEGKKQPPKIHNLLELFESLDIDMRKEIREESEKNNIRVQGLLMEHRNGLTEWRYRKARGELIASLDALDAVLRIIVNIYNSKYPSEQHTDNKTSKIPKRLSDRAIEYNGNVFVNSGPDSNGL